MKRDTNNKVLAGVCSGIAKATGLPVLLLRVLFLVTGAGLWAYPFLWLLMPAEKEPQQTL